jgi:hypothetical protein
VEVHAIFGLAYLLFMSKEGVQEFRNYLLADDPDVFEPLYIAQYLLVPVNTIVKSTLHPWMMKSNCPPSSKDTKRTTTIVTSNSYNGRRIKTKVYLKSTLLTDLMHVVKTHGRHKEYDFQTDTTLSMIKNGNYGNNPKIDKTKLILSIDSFMTIWLLTLPEKFKEWYASVENGDKAGKETRTVMKLSEEPIFPVFLSHSVHTALVMNPKCTSFNFLPRSWNLMYCFNYYFEQKELWTTKSIEHECVQYINSNLETTRIPLKQKASTDAGEHNEEKTEVEENKEEEKTEENIDGAETDEDEIFNTAEDKEA